MLIEAFALVLCISVKSELIDTDLASFITCGGSESTLTCESQLPPDFFETSSLFSPSSSQAFKVERIKQDDIYKTSMNSIPFQANAKMI